MEKKHVDFRAILGLFKSYSPTVLSYLDMEKKYVLGPF
jgi:hypothetical protein